MPLLLELAELDLQLLSQELLCPVNAAPQDFTDAKECRLVILNHAGRRRNRHLTVGEDIELLNDLFGIGALRQLDQDLDLVRSIVIDMPDPGPALCVCCEDGLDQRGRCRAVGNLGHGEKVLAALLDARPDLNPAAAHAIVVFRKIGDAAGGKVRDDPERLSLEMIDCRTAEVVEVVREDLRREPDRDTLGTLGQHERKLDRQGDRFLRAAVVAELPDRCLGIEHHLARKGREARLDVAGCRSAVAGQEIPEVALRLDEQAPLGHADEGSLDRRVAVRMEAHGRPDDVGHLVKPAVVHFPQRVEDPALHRLQTVVDMRDGAVEDDVARVFEKPVPIALRQRRLGGTLGVGSLIFDRD